jgi:hypothetical protein
MMTIVALCVLAGLLGAGGVRFLADLGRLRDEERRQALERQASVPWFSASERD